MNRLSVLWTYDQIKTLCAEYEAALRLIAESEENTLRYPEDMYYHVVKIAQEALQDD